MPMKKVLFLLALAALLWPLFGRGEDIDIWRITDEAGVHLTDICEEPHVGDAYIAADNAHYEIIGVNGRTATALLKDYIELPSVDWMDADAVLTVSAKSRRIALYCTHSDESYEPSDGFYSTNETGTIYQVAHALAEHLTNKGIEATVADTLHHPHDAGAYRRSRQTAVQLLKTDMPDCLIDIHRDGIPDPASYAVTIGGEEASKIRLLVGRGNQNAEVNKAFALLIKAVADRVYPGLIKDIYMGKGTFNQDLLPRSILFECGTYTLDKERVLTSMPMMADVLNRALYGGVVGSAGRVISDAGRTAADTGGITQGQPDVPAAEDRGIGSGAVFLGGILLVGIAGYAMLSAGSAKGGAHKAARHISEMTGGLIGKKPEKDEDHQHS